MLMKKYRYAMYEPAHPEWPGPRGAVYTVPMFARMILFAGAGLVATGVFFAVLYGG